MSVGAAGVEKFLAHVVGLERVGRLQNQIAAERTRVGKKRGASVAIGVHEIRARTARHQQVLENAAIDERDALGIYALVVHGITSEQRLALEFLKRGIVHQRDAHRKHARADAARPFAATTETLEECVEFARHRKRRARTGKRRFENLRQS